MVILVLLLSLWKKYFLCNKTCLLLSGETAFTVILNVVIFYFWKNLTLFTMSCLFVIDLWPALKSTIWVA